MSNPVELARTLETKRGELTKIFADHADGQGGIKATIPLDEVNRRNDELNDLGRQYEEARRVAEIAKQNADEIKRLEGIPGRLPFPSDAAHPKGGIEEPGTAVKTAAQIFTEDDAFKNWERNGRPSYAVRIPGGIKTLLTTATGYAPFIPRSPLLVYSAQRKPVVADLIPSDTTVLAGIRYMQETLFTNNAATVAEGAVKPESALQYTEVLVPMTKIATSIPVTQEQLLYVPQLEQILRDRLGLMVLLAEDYQLLNNPSGNSAVFTGLLNAPGILTQPQGADDPFTAAFKALTQVRSVVGFADPSGFIFHPNDWQGFRTKKDTVGRFILGDPDKQGPEMLWGLPVVPTIAIAQGTGLTGDFRTYAHIDRAMDLTIQVGYVNDQFVRNQATILAEEYVTLEILRPVAFDKITGLSFA